MLNYVRAELYKLLRRKYFYIVLVVLFAGALFLVGGLWFTKLNGNNINFAFGTGTLVAMLLTGLYLVILSADMVFSEQYKQSTLKNEVSFGLPRARIFFGKLLVQILVSIIICLFVVVVYEGLCWAALSHDAQDMGAVRGLLYSLAGSLPLWLAAQALTNAIFFNIKNEMIASLTVVGILSLFPTVIELISYFIHDGFMILYQNMPTILMNGLGSHIGNLGYLARCWMVGLIWFVIASVLGILGFQRKELN